MTLKEFKFSTEEDFLYYLKILIILAHKTVNRYEEQVKELEEYIQEHNLIERPKRVVSYKVYEDFRAKLSYTSTYILNLFGDESEFGTSYKIYRKKAKKRGIKILDLNDEQLAELNEVTTSRDWVCHIPASLLHSSIDRAFNLRVNEGPISFPEFKRYRGIWLITLFEKCCKNLEGYKGLLNLLKKEYEVLTGEPCIIMPFKEEIREIDDLQIPEISWLIQNKKIKSIEDIKKRYEQTKEA